MGDSFEVAVDVDATLDEAPELAGTVVKWLSDRGIIGATPTDDRDAWGAGYYLPGPDHRPAVVHPGDPYVVAVAQSGRGRLEVTVGRAVFYPTQGTPGPAVCPLCRYAVALVDPETGQTTGDWELFSDALADWHDGGPGTVVCPNNGSVISINEWQWQGDWPIAVGHLGFTFWNWPRLDPGFVSQLGRELGHRVVVTRGKL